MKPESMQSEREEFHARTRATLVDLLDRILDKGLVVRADLIVSVAGIPLIGVRLSAALAGMETMVKYGMMKDWDEQIRSWERGELQRREEVLIQGERVLMQVYGAYYYDGPGIYKAWRWGQLYLTDTRLLLWGPTFEEVIFETPLDKIRALTKARDGTDTPSYNPRDILHLLLEGDEWTRLRAVELNRLKDAILDRMAELGVTLEEAAAHPEVEEGIPGFPGEGEEVLCSGRMWYLVPGDLKGSGYSGTWRPGHLYLTNQRLCWWYDEFEKMPFDMPLKGLAAAALENRKPSPVTQERVLLDVVYNWQHEKKVASFSGEHIEQWENALNRVLSGKGIDGAGPGIEACPRCGQEDEARKLLEAGCDTCGWVSPRSKVAASPGSRLLSGAREAPIISG